MVARWGRRCCDLLLPRRCVACAGPLEPAETGLACGACWSRVHAAAPSALRSLRVPARRRRLPWCELLPPFVRAVRSVCWVPRGCGWRPRARAQVRTAGGNVADEHGLAHGAAGLAGGRGAPNGRRWCRCRWSAAAPGARLQPERAAGRVAGPVLGVSALVRCHRTYAFRVVANAVDTGTATSTTLPARFMSPADVARLRGPTWSWWMTSSRPPRPSTPAPPRCSRRARASSAT